MTTEFEVTRPLKGRATASRTITHSKATGGNCGINFAQGEIYRVFAYRASGTFTTSGCTLSGQINSIKDYEFYGKDIRKKILDEKLSRETREEELSEYEYFAYYKEQMKRNERFFNAYATLVEEYTNLKSLDYFFIE